MQFYLQSFLEHHCENSLLLQRNAKNNSTHWDTQVHACALGNLRVCLFTWDLVWPELVAGGAVGVAAAPEVAGHTGQVHPDPTVWVLTHLALATTGQREAIHQACAV